MFGKSYIHKYSLYRSKVFVYRSAIFLFYVGLGNVISGIQRITEIMTDRSEKVVFSLVFIEPALSLAHHAIRKSFLFKIVFVLSGSGLSIALRESLSWQSFTLQSERIVLIKDV